MGPVLLSAASGLANRLRALVGARALAEGMGVALWVDWRRNGACDAAFDELFEIDGWRDVRFVGAAEIEATACDAAAIRIDGCPWFTDLWSRHGPAPGDRDGFIRRAVALLRELRPTRPVRERVDAFLAGGALDACVGVHIRATDNVLDYDAAERADPVFDRRRVSHLAGFRTLIDARVAAGQGVFLCTDDRAIESELCARSDAVRCHGKAFETREYDAFVKRTYGRFAGVRRVLHGLRRRGAAEASWRTTSVADALVDLLLLGRCGEIVGTYYSSFIEVAALMGDRPIAIMEGERPVSHEFIEGIRRVAAPTAGSGAVG